MAARQGISEKPRPRIGPDNAPFWAGCRERRLLLPWCQECGRPHLPPGPVCPHCLSDRLEWREASGRGTVSTYVVVHKAWFPAFAGDVPYNVAQIELEEGPRLTSRIVGIENAGLRVGLPVTVDFEMVDEDLALPVFRPA